MTTLQTLQGILKADFGIEPEALQPEARLEDLAIDSLAVIEVLFAVEDAFKVTLPSEQVALKSTLLTVGDLVAYVDRMVMDQHPAVAAGERQA